MNSRKPILLSQEPLMIGGTNLDTGIAGPPACQGISVNMVFIYYDNPEMLKMQMAYWNSYSAGLASIPRVILVDDGSPRFPAVDVVKRVGSDVPIEVYRINEDIPWNFSGARNLGCHQATGWIYVSDIDTLLSPENAALLFETKTLDPECVYMPRRMSFDGQTELASGIVNLMFQRAKYFEIGGYDEDYAGFYGKEETDFLQRIKRAARLIERRDVSIRVVPPAIIQDARTRRLVRDKSRNIEVYEQKKKNGFKNPANPLRFTWSRVL